MSDTKQKVSYEQMAFYYEMAVHNALDNLFSPDSQLGWTRDEFDQIYYTELAKNALQGSERILH